jgi:hypothetical protein
MIRGPHPIAPQAEVQPPSAEIPPEAEKEAEIGPIGVLDTDLPHEVDDIVVFSEGRVLVHRLEVVTAGDVATEDHSP